MKKIMTILLLTLTVSAIAEIGLQFNLHGEFIPPDMVLQARGLEQYEGGYIDSATKNFKKSAKFGNDRSKYLLALLNFQNKNWVTGYAWLGLISESMENKDGLMQKVGTLLTTEELALSVQMLEQLKKEYNDTSSFKRRNKWERSLKGSGTHISGIDAMSLRGVTTQYGDTSIPVTSYELKKQVETYVYEYVPRGIVEMGVIKAIENNK